MHRRRALQASGAIVTGTIAGCLRGIRDFETYRHVKDAPVDGPVAIPWRTQAYDARRSGYTAWGWLPPNLAISHFASARKSIEIQPAFVDDIAYFGADHVEHDSRRRRSGVRSADYRGKGWFSFQESPVASPTVVSDAIFVTSDGMTRALDRRDGTLCWEYREGSSHPTASPTAIDDTVYVTGERVFALAAATGEVRWSTDRADTILRGTAATREGVFATGGSEGRGSVYRFEPETGRERWSRSTSSEVLVPPVLGELVYVVEAEGRLRALNPSDGSEAWSRELDGRSTSMPAIAEETVYAVATNGNTLDALDALTGDLRWEFDFDARSAMGPTIARDTVYLPTGVDGGGFIHPIEADTGTSSGWRSLPREPVSSLVIGAGSGLIATGSSSSETHLYLLNRAES